MQVVRDLAQWPAGGGRPVVTVGNFDGIHLGHQRLIDTLVARARQRDTRSAVVTFNPHPLALLAPERLDPLITPGDERLHILERFGVSVAVVLPFTHGLAAQSGRSFAARVLSERLRACHVVLGPDSRFGHGREAGFELLQALGPQLGFTAESIPPVVIDGVRVSSSAIRRLIVAGAVDQAARLLGRYYRLRGEVVRGHQRGRELGFPTANLAHRGSLVPADGVYVGRAWVQGEPQPAVINIGNNPTFGERHRTVEAHLIDWNGSSLYGEQSQFEFHRRLRGEVRFPNSRALAEQLAADVAAARAALRDA